MFLHHITRHRQTTKSTQGVVCASLFLGIRIKIRALTSDGYPLFFCFSSCVFSLQICFEQKIIRGKVACDWEKMPSFSLYHSFPYPPQTSSPMEETSDHKLLTNRFTLIRPYLDAYGKIEVNFKKVQKFLFEKSLQASFWGHKWTEE